jgi:transcriptional regulator with XRE-family HTH domain
MSLVRAGLIVRALRRNQGLRQADLASRVGLTQQTVSRIERGWFGALSVDDYRRVVEALGARVDLAPRWRGPKLDQLLDERHSSIQNSVACELARRGWVTRTEVTFSHYGERGSIDTLGWRPDVHALLVLETKSELVSLEETLRTLDMKVRLAPRIVAPELGWVADPARVGAILVLPHGSTSRGVVDRHAALLDSALPGRTVDARRWLARPGASLRAIWFVRITPQESGKSKSRPPDRIRVASSGGSGPKSRSDLRGGRNVTRAGVS